ncbi:MHYT domain-containing protein [Alicyclobacillus sp.]|uniref:MHYT domain-containing protein n=1 Tax=Alicyclobacillus sp. TaxID=61169 RepID=UPI0025BBF9D1|nr:MHYT domain-containing protein [Alicyclobacillus sp.]MCL6516923.1 PAS domain-containing protein [Alicyclobacillus sp.]
MEMGMTYSPWLVALSIGIAIAAAFAAQGYVYRVAGLPRRDRQVGVAMGALAMGTGIWTMHFVGMLAMRTAVPVRYGFGWTFWSWLLAVAASYLAFAVFLHDVNGTMRLRTRGAEAVLMAAGIVGMHYSGMRALQGVRLSYAAPWTAVAVGLALAGSIVALTAFRLPVRMPELGWFGRLMSAVGLGGTICGMHYSAMAGTRMAMTADAMTAMAVLDRGQWLAVALTGAIAAIMGMLALALLADKRAAVRLQRHSDMKYTALFEANPDLVLVLDATGVVVDANHASLEMLGYAREEMRGRRWSDIGVPVGPHGAELMPCLKAGAKGLELQARHRQGRGVRIDFTLIPMRDGDRFVGCIAVGKDVTHQREEEERMAQVEKLRVVGQLAAGLAHEIRNPVTTVKGFLQLLREKVPEKEHYFSIVLDELDRIERITNELLVMAKPQFPNFEEHDVRLLVQETLTLMTAQANLRNIELSTAYGVDIPSVRCDGGRLKQAFVNLVKNALEATPEGGRVCVSVAREQDEVVVEVRDTGPGIPDDVLQHLGVPFYTTKPNGTGLGLTVTQRILQDHDGRLEFTSIPGQGTRARVHLPIGVAVSTAV